MQDDKDKTTRERNNNRIPESVKGRDPTPLGDNVVSLGKMVVYYESFPKSNGLMKVSS